MGELETRDDAIAKGAQCETCPLLVTGAYVPSYGPNRADVAIVGEAPGAYEARNGIPFTGPTGRLLNSILEHVKHPREEVFLTNATLCRPPSTDPKKQNEPPPEQAVRACKPRLLKELGEHEVSTVVTLGNTASQDLLNVRTPITRLRIGPPKSTSYGFRVIPTIHPAAALRHADSFPHIVTDFQKLNGSKSNWSLPKWRATTSPSDALAVLDLIHKFPKEQPIVVDIETAFDKDETFDHPQNYDLLCVGICYAVGRVIVIDEQSLREPSVLRALGALLRSRNLIMHNGKSDCAGLSKTCGDLSVWFDTMLAHYVLDERTGGPLHGLEVLGMELLGTPKWKDWVKPYVTPERGYADIPRDLLYKYNAVDCAVTWDLYELFSKQLDDEGLRAVHEFLVGAADQLKHVEMEGIAFDLQRNEELHTEYLAKLDAIKGRVEQYVEGQYEKALSKKRIASGEYQPKLNLGSPKQVGEYLNHLGVQTESTDEEHINELLELIDNPRYASNPTAVFPIRRFCSDLLEYRKEAKLYGTYIKGLRKNVKQSDGRVYSTFLLHGTWTGRLSSRSPNLQNIPRGSVIKAQFVPSGPGSIFVQCDYKAAELRVIACLAKDEYLRDILSDDSRDIHSEFSDIIFGTGKWNKEQRVLTKSFVYGIAYGRTPEGIASAFGISVEAARQYHARLTSSIPATMQWRQEIKGKILRNQELTTPFGRKRRFWLITPENQKDVIKEGLSFIPQSTASDICLTSLCTLRPLLKEKFDADIRVPVHDSILVECRKEDAEAVRATMVDVMGDSGDRVFQGYVPFTVDSAIGSSWAEV